MTLHEKPSRYQSIMVAEANSHIETSVFRATGLSVAEFRRAHEAGELDDADPMVRQCAALVRLYWDDSPPSVT